MNNLSDIENLDKFQPLTRLALETEVEKQTREFQELLVELSNVDIKLKVIWTQIYNNALFDRKNAYIAFIDLYAKVHSNEDKHALHAQNIVKYLERMEKANEQLIKVAKLVQEAIKDKPEEEEEENTNSFKPTKTSNSPRNIFQQLKQKQNNE